jgi:hypothetical protein
MTLEKNVVDSASGTGCKEKSATEAHLARLLLEQNEDGGWGYYAGKESRVEPSGWSLLALLQCDSSSKVIKAREHALRYLVGAQLENGSWPAAPQQAQGAWVTAVACLAVQQANGPAQVLRRAAKFLCNAWPRDGAWWRRLVEKLRRKPSVSKQNSGYRGWSWTPGTSSWVEPTACALIALHNLPSDLLPRNFAKRRRLAEAMLTDRMCPGGGWNSGNPMVYGVPGIPNADMTCLALLALLWSADARAERDVSLRWLTTRGRDLRAAKSRAMAEFCLRVHGDALSDPFTDDSESEEHCGGETLATVWKIMAAAPSPNWLPSPQGEKTLL